ncbi:MAG: toxin-antitoxin system HicB family antitoxin [Chlorobiaceae bacterium]|nr:toxin-antitoxin system HicB family antitoxin [Chlorobiaceae bacterium]
MSKANVLTIRVLSELKNSIVQFAEEQKVSINQFVMYILDKQIWYMEAGHYLSSLLNGYSKKEILADFGDVMAEVKMRSVLDWDEM